MPAEVTASPGAANDLDHRGRAWYVDKIVGMLVFVGGISAIVFIIGIFMFIFREGAGFIVGPFAFGEFFGQKPRERKFWDPDFWRTDLAGIDDADELVSGPQP